MNINQIKDLFIKIGVHRPKFSKMLESISTYNQYLKEWYGVLKKYDENDVLQNLEQWLSSEENKHYLPDVYSIVRDLYTIDEKNRPMDYSVGCQYCKRLMPYKEIRLHEERCRNVEYIYKNYKKLFNKELSKKTLWQMNLDEFNKKYYQCLELFIKELDSNTLEYRNIKNVIATKNGGKPIYSINGEEIEYE